MSDLMFPKPIKSPKKAYKGLQAKKPLQTKTQLKSTAKLKNKGSKYKNDRVEPNTPCEFNYPGCTGNATDNHELKAGASHRTNSAKHGFKVQICRSCHSYWDEKVSKHEKNHVRANKQREVMAKQGWDKKRFIEVIGQNYL